LYDAEQVRKDFPILNEGVIYLDSAASSLTPEQVVLKEMEFYRHYRANVERGVHTRGSPTSSTPAAPRT
jgi:cysteine desulfurase/selenocysteine lyase